MITKNQAKAYASITLDSLYKIKTKINPEKLVNQMNLMYDLYETNEVEELYDNMIKNNKILFNNISGRANCYIINAYNSAKKQINLVKKYCGNNIKIGKMYITPDGENTDKYYELIKDIRNKNMDILFMNIYTIYSMSEREKDIAVHLCRKNGITFVEI